MEAASKDLIKNVFLDCSFEYSYCALKRRFVALSFKLLSKISL